MNFGFKQKQRIITNTIRLRNLIYFGKVEPTEYYINQHTKIAYIENPKVACTTIKKIIYYEQKDLKHSHTDFHLFANKYKKLHLNPKDRCNLFCFSFVRNPFYKVISCYEDKIRGERYTNNPFYGSYWDRFVFYFFSNRMMLNKDISFDSFVDSICKIPDTFADRHIRSQYSTLFHNNKPLFSYLGKLENFDLDILPILDKLDISKAPFENKSSKNTKYTTYLTNPITAKKIVKRYYRDFKAFNYSTNFNKL